MKKFKPNNLIIQSNFECAHKAQTYGSDCLCHKGNVCEKSHNETISQKQPQMRMSQKVFTDILLSICSRPPEAGGILLGPIESNDITDFFYDKGANCSGATYSPDYLTLRRKMKEEWMPSGIDMKGFVHSHPGRLDCLSQGDLNYISKLLQSNEDMDRFFAPIVIPSEYRMRPLVVLRENIRTPQEAELVLF